MFNDWPLNCSITQAPNGREIIERHGGSIVAQNAPGQGATFVVTLPVKQLKGEIQGQGIHL